MKRPVLPVAIIAMGIAACANSFADRRSDPPPIDSASADLRDSFGRVVGGVTIDQDGRSLRIRIESSALPPGAHGAHLHSVGDCAAPDFAGAGAHWNPTGRLHGARNPRGAHLGDLPNLLVGTDGRGTLEYGLPAGSLSHGEAALLDGDGASLVIHQGADDYRSDPSGNSGGRIACGVLSPDEQIDA